MEKNSYSDLISTAQDLFNNAKYSKAESILNQLILNNCKEAVIFQMLGTIYYDHGKFNKAIRAFKRALEIDPGFTDASIGLSIILNDLGRYEEGRKVFEEAQALLAYKNRERDPYINEKLSIKHDELGELYFQYKRFDEALEQFYKALGLSNRKAELTMKIAETYLRLGAENKAIQELNGIIDSYPDFVSARLKLGEIFYDNSQAHLARAQWEKILKIDPKQKVAKRLLKQLDEGEGLDDIRL